MHIPHIIDKSELDKVIEKLDLKDEIPQLEMPLTESD